MLRHRLTWVLLVAGLSLTCGVADRPARTIRGAYAHPMVSLDPHAQNDAMTGAVLSAIYEPLVSFSQGEGIRPCLAESWTTPDDTTWRFRLRRGLHFHSGRPVQVEDVIASIDRVQGDSQSAVSTYLEAVTEVHAIAGPVPELELRTRAPFPLLLARLANVAIVPAGFDPETPTGTGPYRWFGGSGHTSIVLRSWQGYWGPRPNLDEVELIFADTEELVARPDLLETLDFVPRVTRELLDRLSLDQTWRVIRNRSTSTTILGINVSRPPYGDPRVRRAIDLAIDRRGLVEAAYPDGAAAVAVSLAPPEVFGFLMTDQVKSTSPDKARELLREAGVARGTPCRLEHAGQRPAAVRALVAALNAIGLDVKPLAMPYEQFYRSFESGVEADLFLFGWNFRFADASDLLDSLVHTRGGDQLLGRLNAAGYSSPDVDLWIQEALHEPRSAERLKLLRLALSRVAQDRPYIPLYHPGRYALLRTDLEVTSYPGSWLRPQDISRAEPGSD